MWDALGKATYCIDSFNRRFASQQNDTNDFITRLVEHGAVPQPYGEPFGLIIASNNPLSACVLSWSYAMLAM